MDKDYLRKYKEIAVRSYETKLNLFIFNQAIKPNKIVVIDQGEFENYQILGSDVNLYTTVYWQEERNYKINGIWTVDDIYKRMKVTKEKHKSLIDKLKVAYVTNFEAIFPKVDFEKLLIEQNCCHYCQITIDKVKAFASARLINKKNERGWTLEIDRKDSNLEYTYQNCVMACYWCNNAKTDEFTEEEFLEVGMAIKKIWEQRRWEDKYVSKPEHLNLIKK